jgi:hypothetical protein
MIIEMGNVKSETKSLGAKPQNDTPTTKFR